ncbi:MAG: ECF transporter S component [Ruminococcaceae bacterium]|nr:ECF transporter S component [Oscillospiraceae bacterium]MBR3596312.1 ECF transporter S component [Clostridia bacterium]
MEKQKNKTLLRMVTTGMMSALAVVLMFLVRVPLLPSANFLEYDMGDLPVILSTLFIGYPHGMAVLLFVSAVQSLTVSASSNWPGFVMHILSTGCYVLIVYLFMRHSDSIKRLIVAVITATAALSLVMIPLNLIFTPIYMSVPVEAVIELILPAILPFNILKGVINSVITVALYPALKKILTKSDLLLRK